MKTPEKHNDGGKRMRKIASLFMVLAMSFALAACGAKNTANNEITELYDNGFSCIMTMSTEEYWKGVFRAENNDNVIFFAQASLTKSGYEAYNAIDLDDVDGMRAFLGTLTDVTVTDISGKIPSQDELDAYIGKTLGDLEDAGFENTGFFGEDGINQFFYDGPIYCWTVTLADGAAVENMDDYSANDLRALKIGAVEYTGLSSMILEHL